MTRSDRLVLMAGNRVVNATEFKARCLSLLDEVEQHGAAITVTRRGRPLAVLGPSPKGSWKSPRDRSAGKARIVGDIVNADTAGSWDIAGMTPTSLPNDAAPAAGHSRPRPMAGR